MKEATVQLPRQMSTLAADIDNMYYFIFWVSVVFFVAIIGAAIWFLIKYRRDKNPHSTPPGHHDVLELFWTFAPLILLIPMFHYGFKGYVQAMVAPDKAIEIKARGKQWVWDFYYPGDTEPTPGELVVPMGLPVKMQMSSLDVLHSFFIPEFRVKRDLVPGMYTTLWFEATQLGRRQIFCTEYCGTSHSAMLAEVEVLSQEAYDAYIAIGLTREMQCPECPDDVAWGAQLYRANACFTCHSTDGSVMPGPTWQNIWGRETTFTDGTTDTVDEQYVRESLFTPQAKIVQGYQNVVMPTFQGSLNDAQIDALIAYMRTL
jgi:cytochrome c oxidase subunit 2